MWIKKVFLKKYVAESVYVRGFIPQLKGFKDSGRTGCFTLCRGPLGDLDSVIQGSLVERIGLLYGRFL